MNLLSKVNRVEEFGHMQFSETPHLLDHVTHAMERPELSLHTNSR
jgi:hypothetical protein